MHVVGDWMHVVAFVSASRVRFRFASRVWCRVARCVQFSFGFQIASRERCVRVRCVGDG
jgi:hypothetical protein